MIKNLVLTGGGIKTISIIGALKFLQSVNYLKGVKTFCGTSAGSIYCLLLVLGYSVENIVEIFADHCNGSVFDLQFTMDIFFTEYRLYNTTKFTKLIQTLIGCKLCKTDPRKYKNITLLELYNITGKRLIGATVSLKTKSIKYFDHINQPNLPVHKLILMSCAIPFIFAPVFWQDDLFVDGGLIESLPVSSIPISEKDVTLGICIKTNVEDQDISMGNITEYIKRIINIALNNSIFNYAYKIITVTIDEKYNSDIVNGKISIEDQNRIIQKAFDDTKVQFEQLHTIKRRKSF